MHILDQPSRLGIVFEIETVPRSVEPAIAGEERLQEPTDRFARRSKYRLRNELVVRTCIEAQTTKPLGRAIMDGMASPADVVD